jgi:hypothetical protein
MTSSPDYADMYNNILLIRNAFHAAEDKIKFIDSMRTADLPFRVNWDFLLAEWLKVELGESVRNRSRGARRLSPADKRRRFRRFGTK